MLLTSDCNGQTASVDEVSIVTLHCSGQTLEQWSATLHLHTQTHTRTNTSNKCNHKIKLQIIKLLENKMFQRLKGTCDHHHHHLHLHYYYIFIIIKDTFHLHLSVCLDSIMSRLLIRK